MEPQEHELFLAVANGFGRRFATDVWNYCGWRGPLSVMGRIRYLQMEHMAVLGQSAVKIHLTTLDAQELSVHLARPQSQVVVIAPSSRIFGLQVINCHAPRTYVE